MSKDKSVAAKPVEERGGYPSGDKLMTELKPPPPGPAPGAKPSGNDSGKVGRTPDGGITRAARSFPTHILSDIIQSVSECPPGLLPIFRSRHQLRLLGELFVHAGSEFSIAELQRRTGVPQQTISREVERLSMAGLLGVRTVGRTKLVEANAGSPYFPDLRGLLLKATGPAVVLGDRLRQIPGIDEAYVFGSWASRYEGEVGPPPADVDVLVVGDADPDAVDAGCAEAGLRLGLEVNPVVLSEEEWRGSRSGFVRQVRKEPLVRLSLTGP